MLYESKERLRVIRPQSVRPMPKRHRLRRRGSAPCFRSWYVRAVTGRHAGFRCAGKSRSVWCAASCECRRRRDRGGWMSPTGPRSLRIDGSISEPTSYSGSETENHLRRLAASDSVCSPEEWEQAGAGRLCPAPAISFVKGFVGSLCCITLPRALSYCPFARRSINCKHRPSIPVLVRDVDEKRVSIVLDTNLVLRMTLFMEAAHDSSNGRASDERSPARTSPGRTGYDTTAAIGREHPSS